MYEQTNIVRNGLLLSLNASIYNTVTYGSTWFNIGAIGTNGTFTNGPTFNSSDGGSIEFDGTNDYVSFGNSGTTTTFDFGTGNMTCFFWMRPTAWADGASRGVISKKANDTTSGWVIYNDGGVAQKINARFGTTNNFASSTNVTTNTWQCWALTRSASTLSWYYNGVFDTSGSNSVSISDTTVELQVGHSQTWDGYFKGNMGIMMFYNRALSAAEILHNYNATKGRFGL